MSFDRVYLCRSLDKSTWCVGWHDEIAGEFQRAYNQGDFVVLVAGENLLFDELYIFEHSSDAERFFETDFAGREFIVEPHRPMGFQEISLYRGGQLVATKNQPAAVGG